MFSILHVTEVYYEVRLSHTKKNGLVILAKSQLLWSGSAFVVLYHLRFPRAQNPSNDKVFEINDLKAKLKVEADATLKSLE